MKTKVLNTVMSRQAQSIPRRIGRRDGQTTVEFALIMPFVAVLLLASVEFGWVIENSMTMANAARETARSAALGNATSSIGAEATNMASPLRVNTLTMPYSPTNATTPQPHPP